MPHEIQLICTDFDGTIFAEFEDPPVAERFCSLVADAQKRGAKWVINTGRDLSSLLEALGRANLHVHPDFLVLVEREIVRRDNTEYVPHKQWNESCSAAHAALFQRMRPDLPRLIRWISERYDATLYEDYYSPLCLIAEKNEDAEVIHAYLNKYCAEIPGLTVVRNDVYARFSHESFNKGAALSEVARILGLAPDAIFVAGDHLNDLSMLSRRHAAYLAAPDNAIDCVKAAVREQSGHVSALPCALGVAEALEKYLRNGH